MSISYSTSEYFWKAETTRLGFTLSELPAVNVNEVVNTVGAGDALFSSFIHFYAKGLKPIDCLKRAEVFAAYKIGFDGASVGFTDEETVEKLTMKYYC